MSFLFFGGWACSAIALLLGALLLGHILLDLGGYKFSSRTTNAASWCFGIWLIAAVVANVSQFIVGSVALSKGLF